MIHRQLQEKIVDALGNFPVVSIVGPRQCGKTTLAREIASGMQNPVTILDLESPSDIDRLVEPELYLGKLSGHLVIIDEVQHMPELFAVLRVLVDADRRNGRFLLLGSSSPDIAARSSESLAGRIRQFELTPLILDEIGCTQENLETLWLRGGFPLSVLANDATVSMQWRQAFIQTWLERDLPRLGGRMPVVQARRLWQMLAHLHGKQWNGSEIAAGIGISHTTARHYLDLMTDAFLVRQLHPYHVNIGKRLVKAPRVYLRDSGLLHVMHAVDSMRTLMGHPVVGPSWEGFLLEQIAAMLPPLWEMFYYRTHAGAEIDCVLVAPGARPVVVEIKHSLSAATSRGFYEAFNDLSPSAGFVLYSGTEFYEIRPRICAVPVSQLSRIFQ